MKFGVYVSLIEGPFTRDTFVGEVDADVESGEDPGHLVTVEIGETTYELKRRASK